MTGYRAPVSIPFQPDNSAKKLQVKRTVQRLLKDLHYESQLYVLRLNAHFKITISQCLALLLDRLELDLPVTKESTFNPVKDFGLHRVHQ